MNTAYCVRSMYRPVCTLPFAVGHSPFAIRHPQCHVAICSDGGVHYPIPSLILSDLHHTLIGESVTSPFHQVNLNKRVTYMHLPYLPQRFIQLCFPVLITALIIGYLQYQKTSLTSTMPNQSSPQAVAASLLAEKGLEVVSITLLQSLWAGYGQICRIEAIPRSSPSKSQVPSTGDSTQPTPQEPHSYILKLITPPPSKRNNEGHTRKILSYQIEQYFYTHLAPQMPSSIPVANCLASINEQHQDGTSTTAMILTDLKQDFP